MRVIYLGQCGFLLDFGHTRIVTDPYLSDAVDRHRPGDAGWTRQYPAPAALMDLAPDGILISHAHDDHMDGMTLMPYVRAGGTARMCAPKPEVYRLTEMGVKNTYPCRAEEPFCIGGVTVTPIPCAHTQLHLSEEGCFHELSYIVSDGENKVFFGGDMSLYDGLVRRLSGEGCQILLLPVNGRDEERTRAGIIGNIDEREAAWFARALGAPYVPAHHDLYTANGCPVERAATAAKELGADIRPLEPGEELTLVGGRIR